MTVKKKNTLNYMDCETDYLTFGVITLLIITTSDEYRKKKSFNNLESNVLSGLFSLVVFRHFFYKTDLSLKIKKKLSIFAPEFVNDFLLLLTTFLINGIVTKNFKIKYLIITACSLFLYYHVFEKFVHQMFPNHTEIIDIASRNTIIMSLEGLKFTTIILNIGASILSSILS